MMNDRVKRGIQWVLWSPWRLALVIALIFLLWLTVQTLTPADELPPASPSPSTSVDTSQLPEGWETWPSAAAR